MIRGSLRFAIWCRSSILTASSILISALLPAPQVRSTAQDEPFVDETTTPICVSEGVLQSLRLRADEATLHGRNHPARQPLAEPGDKGQGHELEIGLRSLGEIERQYLCLQDCEDEQSEG